MFLRNLARSFSFSNATLKGLRGGSDQRAEDTSLPSQSRRQAPEGQAQAQAQAPSQAQAEQVPASSTCAHSLEVEVGIEQPGIGSSDQRAPAPCACTHTSRPPRVETASAHRSQLQSSASALVTIVAAAADDVPPARTVINNDTPHYCSTSNTSHLSLQPHVTDSAQVTSDHTSINSTQSASQVLHLDSTSADHNSASNFPSRPLHPQTLSPTADHVQSVEITKEQSSLVSHTAKPNSQSYQASDEPEIAMQRRVWVKRPGASATRVEVNEDDLVDNVRDVILRKYANSLGRHIDSPDITLKIVSREQNNKNVASERVLGPEESIGRTLDTYYPGGQAIEEALLIEVPQKRTPKPSPRPGNHHLSYYLPDDYRPGDGARDYFPPMPLHSPHIAHIPHPAGPNGTLPVHSMSVLTTGHVPALPSPGGHNRPRHIRPKYGRQHTSSPTIIHTSQPNNIDGKPQINGVAAPSQPLPTPPPVPGDKASIPAPNRPTSPHPGRTRKKRQATAGRDLNNGTLPTKPASANLLDGRVPPINVLLVEDNVINLKLLEQFMKRLKVRWKSAMNGREAVNMWRKGGFHLVLMDIQLPVMNGLEATKEIRRLESVNGIGLSVFGEALNGVKSNANGHLAAEDELENRDMFKSPVIIVALTASSLQSDRHEALAVGCNDFLTKPVNFGWMERKVTEWGCMQALIDFDGWRRWKEIAEKKASEDPEKRKQEEKDEKAKAKAALKAMFSRPPPTARPSPAAKKDNEATNKKDDESGGPTSPPSGSAANTNGQAPSRRSHKGSRSQSGNIGSSLGITMEVDEKDL